MAKVSNRYVDALIALEDYEKYLKLLKDFTNLYLSTEDLRVTLNHPYIDNKEKYEVVSKVIDDKTFMKFVNLLIKENRISLIEDIYHKYEKKYNDIIKKEKIEIISCSKLDKEEMDKIAEKYKKISGAKEISYVNKIDENIIGGIKVIAGSKIYDASVATKLKNLFEEG